MTIKAAVISVANDGDVHNLFPCRGSLSRLLSTRALSKHEGQNFLRYNLRFSLDKLSE